MKLGSQASRDSLTLVRGMLNKFLTHLIIIIAVALIVIVVPVLDVLNVLVSWVLEWSFVYMLPMAQSV